MVHRLFRELRKRRMTVAELAKISGVERNTIMGWKRRNKPSLTNIRAALNALDFTLAVVEMKEEEDVDEDLGSC